MSVPRKVYFISEHASQELIHGGVGLVDIEKILLKNNAIPIRFPYHFDFSIRAKIARFVYLLKSVFRIEQGSVIIFQHPLYARMDKLLLRLLRFRKVKNIVCLVADIDGLKTANDSLLQKEINFFRQYNYFILHNASMLRWFRSFHPSTNASLLLCFDFLTKNKDYSRSKTNTIVFAGNLQKSTFLENLDKWLENNASLHINLYGPYITAQMLTSNNVSYKGSHHPYSLPDSIEGSFGLIWDGESIEQPAGSLGNYMQYINHHKLSLYIVCNLPVIVHEDTGSAELVKKYNIGFTVQALHEVESKINELSDAEYTLMVQNSRQLAKEITSGNCLQKALTDLLLIIEGKEKN